MRALPLTALASSALLACATPKIDAADALGPELVLRSVPQGAEVRRGGQLAGHTPLSLPVRRSDKTIELEVARAGYFPSKVKLDADALYASGGGESWVALKCDNMGEVSDELDADRPADLIRGGRAATRAGRCEDALEFFARALAIDPRFARAQRERATCLFKLHRRSEAIDALEQYLILAPEAPDAPEVQERVSRARGNRDIDLSSGAADEKE